MKILIILTSLLTLSCDNEKISKDVQASEAARQAILVQQEKDIQLCRDLGGVPVTKQSDSAGWDWHPRQLVRCEFPCKDNQTPLEQEK